MAMYTTDRRKTGEAAMKGWATRRRRQADRKAAMERLTEVAESITGEVLFHADPCVILKNTLINWRDRITSALRILEGVR